MDWSRWKKLKKSDWIVIGLVGVLLLVVMIPTENKDVGGDEETVGSYYEGNHADTSGVQRNENSMKTEEVEYAIYLEEKLEEVLCKMEGVGAVEVMITVSDKGESVVEKDRNITQSVTTETDSVGGSRTATERSDDETTIYIETADETYPYIQKEKLPTVEGVVVVAEGGGNSTVVSNISESVNALLSVEAHRIKVVKMCSKEE